MPVPRNALLDLDPGIGQVASTVRFQVVNRDLELVGDIHPIAADSISAKTSGNVKRTLSGFKLDDQTLRDIDPFQHRIKPWWVLEDGTEWPLGVYVFTDAAKHRGTYVDTLTTTLLDQDFILDQGTRTTFGVGQNGSILNGVVDVINQVRITNYRIPAASSSVVADPVTWPAGTSRLKILNDLCNLAGWLPPYFDNDGVLTIRVPPDIDRDPPDHRYSSHYSRVLRSTIVENENLLDAPNVYLVVCSGPSSSEITAFAAVDADLPFSVQNRRFEVVNVTRVQGITTTDQAQQIANILASSAGFGFRNVEFQGFADPRHDLFQTVEWDGFMYREIEHSLKLTPGGPHTHKLTRGGFPRAG